MPRRNVRRGSDRFVTNIVHSHPQLAIELLAPLAPVGCCASGTARCSRCPRRATRTGSRRAPLAHDRRARPACREARGRGRARRSAASRSSCRTNTSGRFEQRRRAARRRRRSRAVGQLARRVDRHARRRRVRQAPTASKFSSASPSGSITLWQPAHAGFARCCSIALAHRLRLRPRVVFGKRRHVRRRRRRRRAEQVVENPLAAHDRRRAVGVRRHAAGCRPCRAGRGAPRRSSVTRRKWLP